MEAAERELFESGVRRAAETSSDDALDAALDELGWPDALAADPRIAVSVLFECQGAANVTSAGARPCCWRRRSSRTTGTLPSCCPRSGRARRRATSAETGAPVAGLGTAALARSDTAIVVDAETETASRRSPSRRACSSAGRSTASTLRWA